MHYNCSRIIYIHDNSTTTNRSQFKVNQSHDSIASHKCPLMVPISVFTVVIFGLSRSPFNGNMLKFKFVIMRKVGT